MPFASVLHVQHLGPRRWKLLEPLRYIDADLGLFVAPRGMTTDFASVPRVFWLIASPADAHEAAVIHDHLYDARPRIRGELVTRAQADVIFYRAMRDLRVPWWRRSVMYGAVRAAGWAVWRKRRRVG